MITKIQKWQYSYRIVIPHEIIRTCGLTENDQFEWKIKEMNDNTIKLEIEVIKTKT